MEAISCMRKQLQDDALRMTERFVSHLCDTDAAEMLQIFSDANVTVGAFDHDWLLTKQGLAEELASLAHEHGIQAVRDVECHVFSLDEDSCVTVSRFSAVYRSGVVHYRLSFVWQAAGDTLQVFHAHLSQGFLKKEGSFSSVRPEAGESIHPMRETIVLRDAEGISHFLSLADIIYVEASRQSTYVHAETGTFRMSEGISHLVERLDSCFVRIHRGFAVNSGHVIGMRPGYVLLDEGTSLPVPSRRLTEVRTKLAEALAAQA